MSSEIAISAQDLGKAYLIYRRPEHRLAQMVFRWKRFYEEYWALRDVSLELKRGESVGVIGRNGSGKSTLLQLICGTLSPTTGSVSTHGRVAALLELGAGFNPEFTGRENVVLSASVLGLTDEQIKARMDDIIAFAGIGEFIDQPVKVYSSGMYARLAFAVAAHVDADILILDEILAVGDAAFTQKCMRFIRKFRETGTLLFVSHDSSAVTSLCDRAVWIDRGVKRAEGPAGEICQAYHTSIEQEVDDGSAFAIGGARARPPIAPVEDARGEEVLRHHKDAIELFSFNPDTIWHGRRGISVESVRLHDSSGPARVLSGGEVVTIEITCQAHEDVHGPIVGFFIRNRFGQDLFGDNTFLTRRLSPLGVAAGGRFRATFRFQMPFLPTGDYSMVVAVAEGSQDSFVQHHWLNDALFFRVHSSHVAQGLVGIPMLGIELQDCTRELSTT